MQTQLSVHDTEILVDYVEAAEPFISIDGDPQCGCDEWSVCGECAHKARRMSAVLKEHGFPCAYGDGYLSIAARECAERMYANYCVQVGRTPIGITM